MRDAPEEVLEIVEPECGLTAFLVIDDTRLGPAAGGIRTRAYAAASEARDDAVRLARAMTVKCALAGLAAGGGKCVVMAHPGLDRPRAFAALGRRIEALGGRFRTAGDLGTTEEDLEVLAGATRYVHTGSDALAESVARGLVRCAEACAAAARWDGLGGRRVVVQGAGSIGAAVVRALIAASARVQVADVDEARVLVLVTETGAVRAPPLDALEGEADLIAPCAVGGVVTPEVASRLRARALCGAANNILSEPRAAQILRERGILHVPDVIASAGAVIDGIGRTVMGLADRTPLIDALGDTARAVLEEAARRQCTTEDVAQELAARRLAAAAR